MFIYTANLHSNAELDISKWNAWVTLKDELKDNQGGSKNTPLESLHATETEAPAWRATKLE